jgi:probable F420-dependent oxidoreductase
MRVGVTAFLTDCTISPQAFAVAAEERGFASLYLPEHTHLPVAESDPPALVEGVSLDDYRRSLDPMAALAAAAAVTRRIRLGTGVCLVAQHDPLVLAKQVATIDRLSGGRVVLGVGYGWNRTEAADHGVDFAQRRAIAAEKLRCMQALWSMEVAEFHGTHVEVGRCYSWPKPVQQPRVRVLIGAGASPRTFAEVAELADGWMPIGGAGIADAMPSLHRAMENAGRDPGVVEVVAFGTIPSEGKLEHYRAAGIDEVVLRIPSGPEPSVLACLDDYARFVPG